MRNKLQLFFPLQTAHYYFRPRSLLLKFGIKICHQFIMHILATASDLLCMCVLVCRNSGWLLFSVCIFYFNTPFKMKIQEYVTLLDLSFSSIWTYLLGKVRNSWFLILPLLIFQSLRETIKDNILQVCLLSGDKKCFSVFGPSLFSWDMPFDYKSFLMEGS